MMGTTVWKKGPELSGLVAKFARLLARYPGETGVHPRSFARLLRPRQQRHDSAVVAIQSVADRLYFLLFGAIGLRLAERCGVRVEAVMVRALSGAVGAGWVAELKRAAPVIWLWSNAWVRAFGQAIDGVAYRSATWRYPFHDLADWLRAGRLWKQLREMENPADFRVDGIQVGDLLIDSYLRFRPSPEFNAQDSFTRRLIWQALHDIRLAARYFRRTRPRWYVSSYATYLEHGIPLRVALREGIEAWAFGSLNCFGKRLSLADDGQARDFTGYRRDFDALDRQEERLAEARRQLDVRLSGGIDAATGYMRQSAYAGNAVQLPAGLSGAVVIFLHDFYDSVHVYPELIFNDFWDWVCFTIETLNAGGVRFFLKPHPNQISLSAEVLERLKDRYPGLLWLPASASNVQLASAGIACGITVFGTVAHEMAYMGVPSICCARHPHDQFDFCRTAKSKSEYREFLLSADVMPVSREEMQRQALAFYYMHNLHGDADERALQRAFGEFWGICLRPDAEEAEILAKLHEITELPAFDQFINGLAGKERSAVPDHRRVGLQVSEGKLIT